MKTFEEAVAVIAPHQKLCDITPESEARITAKVMDDARRFESFRDEIKEHPYLEELLKAVFEASCCPKHAMLEIFCLGMRTGIEMEKADFPEVRG